MKKLKFILTMAIGLLLGTNVFAQPTLLTPADLSTGVSVSSVGFTWSSVGGTTSYRIEIDDENTFSAPLVLSTPNITTSYTYTGGLSYSTTYYWRVRVETPSVGSWSSTFEFETEAAPIPGTPSGLSVTGSAVPLAINSSWTPDMAATIYWIQVATDSTTYPASLLDSSSSVTSPHSFTDPGLAYSGTYYWRIRAENGSGTSDYTFWVEVTIPPLPVPTAPTIDYPTCGDTTVSAYPTFIWTPDPASLYTSYTLQVTPDPTFYYTQYSLTISPSDTTYTFSTPFATYSPHYFRMRGTNAAGDGAWTSICMFRVTLSGDTMPPAPVPSWPIGGAEISGTSTSLYWYTLTNIQGYTNFQIWYGTDTTLFTGVPTDTAISGFTTSISGLTAGSTYYWKVRTRRQPNATDTVFSAWSYAASFEVPSAVPDNQTVYLSWPIDGNTVYDTTPTLSWYLNGPYAGLTFDVRLYDDSTSSAIEIASGLSSSSYTVTTTLDYATTYYWRARTDNGTPGTWTYFGSFEVYDTTGMSGGGGGGGSPSTPYLTWPYDDAVLWTNSQILSWYILTAGTDITYTLNIAEDDAFTINSVSFSGLDYPSYGLTALEFGKWYYWRVNSTDGFTTSAWSDTFAFFVTGGGASGIPILYNPGDGWTIYQTNPTLYWFTSAPAFNVTYQLEYDITNTFSSAVTVSGLTDSWYALSSLTLGQTYYWRVRTHNGLGYTAWSAVNSFTVSTGAGPIMPLPGSPTFGVNVGNNSPQVSWYLPTQTNAVLEHELEYSLSSNFSSKVTVTGLNKSFVTLNGLNPHTTYFWRARTKDQNGNYSSYSQPAAFRTGGIVTDAREGDNSPNDYSISQNYPNPFNPSTSIKFSLPVSGFVTVKIYNILGSEVKTMIATEMQAGNYTINWNGEDEFGNKVSSGNYIYRITAGDFVKTMKMTLLK